MKELITREIGSTFEITIKVKVVEGSNCEHCVFWSNFKCQADKDLQGYCYGEHRLDKKEVVFKIEK